jgi:hypothetical protein
MTGGASLFPTLLGEQFVFEVRVKCQSDFVVGTMATIGRIRFRTPNKARA